MGPTIRKGDVVSITLPANLTAMRTYHAASGLEILDLMSTPMSDFSAEATVTVDAFVTSVGKGEFGGIIVAKTRYGLVRAYGEQIN